MRAQLCRSVAGNLKAQKPGKPQEHTPGRSCGGELRSKPQAPSIAINHLIREGYLTAVESGQALQRLKHMRRFWNEVSPDDEVRDSAEQLLGVHNLRAADALQLAAALAWCRGFSRGHYFIVADNHLADAADKAGFNVIRVT